MTRIAILDPFCGISGDMTLGALLDLGLDPEWLRALPGVIGLPDVTVQFERVSRGEISCWKVDFGIPTQTHGRHLAQIRAIVDASPAPAKVKTLANATFEALAVVEASIHGTTVENVHLHEVGAVDAILDVLGAVWGLHQLGVEQVYCGPIALGDGWVDASHGRLPVPAPATLRLLEGYSVQPGPQGSGELTTPTGAALVRSLARGHVPSCFRPVRSGYGAGTRNPVGRANVLRIVLADYDDAPGTRDTLVLLSADVDDMSGEYLADAAETLRSDGALDVTLLQTLMKKGRPGVRLEVLCASGDADRLDDRLLSVTSTIGVRHSIVTRHALPRAERIVEVFGHAIRLKVVTLPGGGERTKPEHDDVSRVASATGRSTEEILAAVAAAR